MTKPVFSLKDVIVTVGDSIQILKSINFDIYDGDFITVLGTNGAGKSTLFNTIAGNLSVASGEILHNGNNIAHETAVKRTNYIARVFQDPKMGTAPRMTVAENLLLAEKRGSKRTLRSRGLTQKKID